MMLKKIKWHQLLIIAMTFVIVVSVIVLLGLSARDKIIQNSALNYANIYSTAIAEFRSLYTSEVVATINSIEGASVRHDYKDHQNSIPLPATLSMLLGSRIGESIDGAETKLYSQYPFPWHADEGGLRDDFARAAWSQFNADAQSLRARNPDGKSDLELARTIEPYYQFESSATGLNLRYAKPDLMLPKCVGCHNSHPDTPKRDWQVGDVRGVLEVNLPLQALVAASVDELTRSFLIYLLVLIVGISFIIKILMDLNDKSTRLETEAKRLEAEVEFREKAENEARQNQQEAEKANVAKSAFLSTMSHELRTPMNAIIGFTDSIIRNYTHDEKQADLLRRVSNASKSLLHLINEILDLSKIEAGKISLEKVEFDLTEELSDIYSMLSNQAEDKGIQLSVNHDNSFPNILIGDPIRLRQVLVNIIGNAIKFTQTGSVSIYAKSISAYGNNMLINFDVQDTGIGMTPEQCERIFSPFSQADDSTNRKFGGTGLGLSISKKLIVLMGGDIVVKTEPGKGSCFSFHIELLVKEDAAQPGPISPMEPVPPAAESMPEDTVPPAPESALEVNAVTTQEARPVDTAAHEGGAPGESAHDTSDDFQSIRILLADQNEENEQLLTTLLGEMGYAYQVANGGKEIAQLCQQSEQLPFEMVMIGIQMPDLDAFEVSRTIRDESRLGSLPIIGLATNHLKDAAENCLVQGMNEYIVAPYTFDQLEKLMIKWTRAQ